MPRAKATAGEATALVGDVVLVRVGGTDKEPELRPGLVVRDWGGGSVNLQVFLDASNDDHLGKLPGQCERADHVVWCCSIAKGNDIGQWRERAGGEG